MIANIALNACCTRNDTMNVDTILADLAPLATDRMRTYYRSQGVQEPFFGVPTGALKPIAKRLKGNQAVAEALYATGNYDAMYLAGMVADVDAMQPADFLRWVRQANCYMLSDFVVSVTLAETDFAQSVADTFIDDDGEFVQSAGWSCYEWLLGSRKDHEFDVAHITNLLDRVVATIATAPLRAQHAMIRFVVAVGVSYKPAHEAALATAIRINAIMNPTNDPKSPYANPYDAIMLQVGKGRLGFKRRHVRC
jgi:hypothetical protein